MSTKVDAINTSEKNPLSVFGSISKGVTAGAITGYAAKYFLPLNSAEMDDEYKKIVAVIREQSNRAKGTTIEAIRNIEKKTPAQDVFLKMVDSDVPSPDSNKDGILNRIFGKQKGSAAGKKAELANNARAIKMRNIIKKANLGPEDMKELKNIIAQVNEKAVKTYSQFYNAFNASVKRIKRPAIAYTISGAVVGFFAGLAHKVITANFDN